MNKTTQIRDLMTEEPTILESTQSCEEAAAIMRQKNIGAVLVKDSHGELCGIVTDRDIVVRCIAEGNHPAKVELGEICSQSIATLSPSDDTRSAVELMKSKAIRRIPVVDNGEPIGIVSLGDLAVALDPSSALGRVSQAPSNV